MWDKLTTSSSINLTPRSTSVHWVDYMSESFKGELLLDFRNSSISVSSFMPATSAASFPIHFKIDISVEFN